MPTFRPCVVLPLVMAGTLLGCASAEPRPQRPPRPPKVDISAKPRPAPAPEIEQPNGAEAIADAASYFPRALGHRSTWDVVLKSATGVLLRQEHEQVITGMETIAKVEYSRLEYSVRELADGALPEVRSTLQRIDEKGLFSRSEESEPEYLEVPFPLRVGTRWTKRDARGTSRYEVAGLEALELGGVVHQGCLKIIGRRSAVARPDFELVEVQHYARGLGRIRDELILDDQGTVRVMTMRLAAKGG